MKAYRRSYHKAINHLIGVGCWEHTTVGRLLVARALRGLRQDQSPERVRWERYHMRQICGMFPAKPGHPLVGED